MKRFIRWLFGDNRKFEIFKNPDYNGHFSVKHMGGYLYINPTQFGGAGLSPYRKQCASHVKIEDALDLIKRWVIAKYGDVAISIVYKS